MVVDFFLGNPVNRDLGFGGDGTKRDRCTDFGVVAGTFFDLASLSDDRGVALFDAEDFLAGFFLPVNRCPLTVPVNPLLACCSGITVFGPLIFEYSFTEYYSIIHMEFTF